MRSYLIFLATIICILTNASSCLAATKKPGADQVTCHFQILEGNIMKIDAEFYGDASGKTILDLGEDNNLIFRPIYGIDHVDNNKGLITIHHKPKSKISFSFSAPYQILLHHNIAQSYLRKLGQGFFIFYGTIFIPIVQATKNFDNKNKNIIVKYSDITGKPATIVTTNGITDFYNKIAISGNELSDAFFILGKEPKLLNITQSSQNKKLHIFAIGDAEISQELITNTQRIFQQQCDFFDADRRKEKSNQKHYLFLVDRPKTVSSIRSNANNFGIVDFNKDAVNDTYQDIAHVIMGHFIKNNGIEARYSGALYHAFEGGFRDFLALRLNSKLNLATPDYQIKYVNNFLKDAATMPQYIASMINPPYANIRYKLFDLSRGFLMSLDIDHMLYTLTDGRYHFEDFMQQMIYKKCKKLKCNITPDDMIDTFHDLIDKSKAINYKSNARFKKLTRYLHTYLESGARFTPPPTMLDGLAKIQYKKLPGADLYFKEESFSKYVVIDPYGPAYNAGLRTGQKLLAVDLAPEDMSKVILKIQDDKGQVRDISYSTKVTKDVPQYVE